MQANERVARLVARGGLVILVLCATTGADAQHPGLAGPREEQTQDTANRCAANSHYMLFRMCGKEVRYDQIDRRLNLTKNGMTLAGMCRCTETLEFATVVVKGDPEYLKHFPLPVIARIEPENGARATGHVVVISDAGPNFFEVIDGTSGMVGIVQATTFQRNWTGFVLQSATPVGIQFTLQVVAIILGAATVGLAITLGCHHRRPVHNPSS